jgi:hypothetical protein
MKAIAILGILVSIGCGTRITETASPVAVPPPTMPSMELMLFSFAASASELAPGESSVLSWTTSPKCTKVEITDIGEVPTNGSIEVRPQATTKYCITAFGPVRLPNTGCVTIKVS